MFHRCSKVLAGPLPFTDGQSYSDSELCGKPERARQSQSVFSETRGAGGARDSSSGLVRRSYLAGPLTARVGNYYGPIHPWMNRTKVRVGPGFAERE